VVRRIPAALMPHRVEVRPYLGAGASGRQWGSWQPERRALVEGMTALASGVQAATHRAFVDLDPDVPLGSLLRWAGATYTVETARRYAHPRAGAYLELALTTYTEAEDG
jgi:hypothetical protein